MILKADYLLAPDGKWLDEGAVQVSGRRIAAVGPLSRLARAPSERVLELRGLILPGLVNAHTHLELTSLAGRIPPGRSFIRWLWDVGRLQRRTTEAESEQSAALGARQSIQSGTTTLADITLRGRSLAALQATALRKVVFLEVMGHDAFLTDEIRSALDDVAGRLRDDPLLRVGLSPHAPYSTGAELYRCCAEVAAERGLPLCTHLAETPDEHEFLLEGRGVFHDALDSLGLLPPEWKAPGATPVWFADKVGFLAHQPLLVHCNYLEEHEIALLARSGASVVFCPRSHAYFGHAPHPFRQLIEAGVNVALGTDSLASSSSLSILDEMRFLRASAPEVPPATILAMATANGARALGLADRIAQLAPGFEADLVVLRAQKADPWDMLFSPETAPVLSLVAGRPLHDPQNLWPAGV